MDFKCDSQTAEEREEAWTKWIHPWNINDKRHPWLPDIDINALFNLGGRDHKKAKQRASFEEANYSTLIWEDLELPPLELQDLIAKPDLSLQQLHKFCGKASAMYSTVDIFGGAPRGRKVAVAHRLYDAWFQHVHSDTWETRYFTRYVQSIAITPLGEIIKSHKILYKSLADQMRKPIPRPQEPVYLADDNTMHHECTLLPTFKDLIIVVDKVGSLEPALLVVLKPERTKGISWMGDFEIKEVDDENVATFSAGMETIMHLVVQMQRRAERLEKGITGSYTNEQAKGLANKCSIF